MVLGKRMWWRLRHGSDEAMPVAMASDTGGAAAAAQGTGWLAGAGAEAANGHGRAGPAAGDGLTAPWAESLNGAPRRIGPMAERPARGWARGSAAAPDGLADEQSILGAPAVPTGWWPQTAGAAPAPLPMLGPQGTTGRQPRAPTLLLQGADGLPLAPPQPVAAPVRPFAASLAEAEAAEAAAPAFAPAFHPAEAPPPAADGDEVADAGGPALQVLTGETAPDLYLGHFGLHERPFSLVPDPGFLFWSRAHARAHSILEYGILTRAPITLITGEVGAGKTTLVHHLLRRLGPGVSVGLISNAHGSRGELLRWVLMALGQPVPEGSDYVTLFSAFQRFLIEQYAAGRRVVLIFDEAQNLDRETLEELRMFTNVNANKDELLQLVLVGQPELRLTIRRPDMAQFAQRVAASFHLPAMDIDAMRGYIAHRLKVAGAQDMLFRNNSLGLIHAATGGVPRLVNQLCDLALVYAYTRNHKTVSKTTVQHVLDDGVFFGAARPTGDDTAGYPGGSGHDA